MHKSFFGLTIYVILFLISCNGGDLSKSDANKQIQEKLKTDQITHDLRLWYDTPHYVSGVDEGIKLVLEWQPILRYLMENNLITMKKLQERKTGQKTYSYLYEVEFKDKNSPYVIEIYEKNVWPSPLRGINKIKYAKLLLAEAQFYSVQRISKPADLFGKKVCNAVFNYKYKATSCGTNLLNPEILNNALRGEALFVLYDDGWKLDDISYQKFSKIIK